MSLNRYVSVVLTVVALELGWIAIHDFATRVEAQQAAPLPVVITGVQSLPGGKPVIVPVALVAASGVVKVTADRPLPVEAPEPLKVEANRPIVVETAERPLLVRSVQAVPSPRPGL